MAICCFVSKIVPHAFSQQSPVSFFEIIFFVFFFGLYAVVLVCVDVLLCFWVYA